MCGVSRAGCADHASDLASEGHEQVAGAKPVSQQDPAETAYQQEAIVTLSEGAFSGGIFFKPVLAGKRLVVQYASVRIEVPPGQTARAALATRLNGKVAFHQFPVFRQGVIAGSPTNRDAFTGGLEIPVYQDGGLPAPAIDLSRSAADGSAVALGTISGYLVDMP
jgi:hypothetical protein